MRSRAAATVACLTLLWACASDVAPPSSPALSRDWDGDGVINTHDHCPFAADAFQSDLDGDGRGDGCDRDVDGDGVVARWDCHDRDAMDTWPVPIYPDTDGDGWGTAGRAQQSCASSIADGWVANGADNCPQVANARQADRDGDGQGDDCDGDADGDGILAADDCDDGDPSWLGPTPYYGDADGDGLGSSEVTVEACSAPTGFAAQAGDPEPECASNDSDDCGVCAGHDSARDCAGDCFGAAVIDGCGNCVGGTSGREPDTSDADGDGVLDGCDPCLTSDVERWFIQFSGVPVTGASEGDTASFQIALGEDGSVLFQYLDVPTNAPGVVATINPPDSRQGGLVWPADAGLFADGVAFELVPDVAGYQGRDSREGDLAFNWYELARVGHAIDATAAEPLVAALPFAFPFYGEHYRTVTVDSRGLLLLGNPDAPGSVAAFFGTLAPDAGGTISFYPSLTTCDPDCDGVVGGGAVADDCGACAGGSTGRLPNATMDCAGSCGGSAEIDGCGVCAGGLTGLVPADADECLPDLVPSEEVLGGSLSIAYLDVTNDTCSAACATSPGERRWLQFTTVVANQGNADLVLGQPPAEPALSDVLPWLWNGCGSHYGWEGLFEYALWDELGEVEVVPVQQRSACLADLGYAGPVTPTPPRGFACADPWGPGQGLTIQWATHVLPGAPCQGLDITGLADGIYRLVVAVNPNGTLPERRLNNNRAEVFIALAGDTVTALTFDCAGLLGGSAVADCAGICQGEAFFDACGLCVGGTTGLEPTDADCLPDLIVDEETLGEDLSLAVVNTTFDACLLEHECLSGEGIRRVMRFSTLIANVGDADCRMGAAPVSPGATDVDPWEWEACHGHYHFHHWVSYRLLDPDDGALVVPGHKNSFCVVDSLFYGGVETPRPSNRYSCNSQTRGQGLTSGWADLYADFLPCQWVDVTGVPDGTYDLQVVVDPDDQIREFDEGNNTATVRVVLDGGHVTLAH
jgi:hypothetical protein